MPYKGMTLVTGASSFTSEALMRTIRIGLVGLGTVGSGVVEIINRHAADFSRRANVSLELARCADRDRARAEALGIAPERFSDDWHDVVGDLDIDVVVELIGGTGVAREVV